MKAWKNIENPNTIWAYKSTPTTKKLHSWPYKKKSIVTQSILLIDCCFIVNKYLTSRLFLRAYQLINDHIILV